MEPEVIRQMADIEDRHWWFQARRGIVRAAIRSAGVRSDQRILEVGSGTGGNLSMLSEFGQVSAMEPSPLARSFVANRSDVTVVDGLLPDQIPFEDNSLDIVAALDVLEHVDEDQASLIALTKLLKPGGIAVVTVPAFQCLWSQHDVAHHHKRRYRRDGLLNLFQTAGLNVSHMTYFNTSLFLPAVFVRSIKKLTGNKSSDAERVPNGLINALLATVFGVERFIVPFARLPFGLSLLGVGRKPR